jgi:hypothetical protein
MSTLPIGGDAIDVLVSAMRVPLGWPRLIGNPAYLYPAFSSARPIRYVIL